MDIFLKKSLGVYQLLKGHDPSNFIMHLTVLSHLIRKAVNQISGQSDHPRIPQDTFIYCLWLNKN